MVRGSFAAAAGTILVLHDTTEFSITRNTPDAVGYLSYVKGRLTGRVNPAAPP